MTREGAVLGPLASRAPLWYAVRGVVIAVTRKA